MFNNFGFVFTGGGAKGAWQLGVWKAFEERGYRAKAVSGTSVGALNACLYAQGDYEEALRAWKEIDRWRMLRPDLFNIVMKGMKVSRARQTVGMLLKSSPISPIAALLDLHGLSSKEDGACSQDGLRELIEKHLNLNKRNFWLPLYVCVHDIENSCPKYFPIYPQDDWSPKELANILLASSAIPVIYSSVTIRGKEYNDGGGGVMTFLFDYDSCEYDNAPKAPLQKLSLDFIIIMELDYNKHYDTIQKTRQGFFVAQIIPSKPLGDFVDGTMNFDKDFVEELVDLGYKDGAKWLKENETQLGLEHFLDNSDILPKIIFD